MIAVDEQIRSAIRRLLLGSIIVIVDLRLGDVDVLADVVGAGLIAWAVVDLYRRFPAPVVPARIMVVAAGVTVLGGLSDLISPATAELAGGDLSVWASTVSTAQVVGSYGVAAVLAHNLAEVPRIGEVWTATARALLVWAVPFVLVIDLLALLGLASGVFLLFAIPILYGLVRHVIALVQTVIVPV